MLSFWLPSPLTAFETRWRKGHRERFIRCANLFAYSTMVHYYLEEFLLQLSEAHEEKHGCHTMSCLDGILNLNLAEYSD